MTAHPPSEPSVGVSTLELFFDLVFVFTITQVTQMIVGVHEGMDLLRAFLVLCTTWWMYAGYVWLTNNINIRLPIPRLLILTAMAGFLVMALAIPRTFSDGGLAYGLAYLLVILIHSGLFAFASNNPTSARAIWGIFPYNVSSGLLVIVAVLVGGQWTVWIWLAAVLVLILSSMIRRAGSFLLHAGHFAERHGLIVLIVLGESLIALGNGAEKEPMGGTLLAAAILGLAFTTSLWWTYFDRDDTRAEHALAQMDVAHRPIAAMLGYGYAHLILIAGIIAVAAGIKQVLSHLHEAPYPNAIWSLGVGLALYLIGDTWFRRVMGIGRGWLRLAVAVLALGTIPLGLQVGGFVQLGVLVALMVILILIEYKRSKV